MVIARIATVALIGCFAATPANSDMLRDWYISAGLGWDHADRVTFENGALLEIDRRGYRPNAALGAKFGENWRVELNGSIQENTPEILYLPSAPLEVNPDERDVLRASSLMANVLRDIPIGIAWRPYVGVGIGVTNLEYRLSETETRVSPRIDFVDDESTTLAFQLIGGFTVPITRRLDLAAVYRYWKAPSPDLEDVNGADLDIDHTVHSVWLHLRYHAPNAGVFKTPAPRRKPLRGFYVETAIGGSFSEDSDIRDREIVLDAYELGPTVTAALGYAWRNRWRFELEGQYRTNEVELVDFRQPVGEDPADGHVKSYSLMANVIHQFSPGSSVRPFFGIGYGFVHGSFDVDVFGVCRSRVCGPEFSFKHVDDDANTTAFQLMAGFDVAVTPRATFTADYRWWRTYHFKMQQPDGSPYEAYLQNRSITVGLRYSLGGER